MDNATTPARLVIFGHEEYAVAPAEPTNEAHARVASVALFILREAHRFVARLSPQQRTQISVPDLAQEAWVALLQRDRNYDPVRHPLERGGYLGFARLVLRQHFARVVQCARTVHVPQGFSEPGKLAKADPENLKAYERAKKTPRPVRATSIVAKGDPVVEAVLERESSYLAGEAVRGAIDGLADRKGADLIRSHYGIDGPEKGSHPRQVPIRLRAEGEARQLLANVI